MEGYIVIDKGNGRCEVVRPNGTIVPLDFGNLGGGAYILEALLEAAHADGKSQGFNICHAIASGKVVTA